MAQEISQHSIIFNKVLKQIRKWIIHNGCISASFHLCKYNLMYAILLSGQSDNCLDSHNIGHCVTCMTKP